MDYQLIAFDMDGTLLDSRKEVLPSSIEAMAEASAAGKAIAICSGRCPSMIELNRSALGDVRYAICGSGAILYDLAERRVLTETSLDHALLMRAIEAAEGEDYICEAFSGTGFFYENGTLERMERYGMGIYVPLYRQTGTAVANLRATLADATVPLQKFNFHFASQAARERVRERTRDLPLEIADSEEASLEFSPTGVDKGSGLLALAELLGIAREATIAVGDADNDLPMLRVAGLGVAMGNANDNARRAASVMVADNDHDGCAEAIRRYLLSCKE